MATDYKYISKNSQLFLLPTTIGGLWAFRLSVLTLINAFIFGNKKVYMWQIGKMGLLLNLTKISCTWIFTYYFGTFVFDITLRKFLIGQKLINNIYL